MAGAGVLVAGVLRLGGWWLVAGVWWLVPGGWLLVAGGCSPSHPQTHTYID